MDIPIDILKSMKEEFYQVSMKGNGLSDYPLLKEFYQDITNVLAGLE
jgi:hypothetical protein